MQISWYYHVLRLIALKYVWEKVTSILKLEWVDDDIDYKKRLGQNNLFKTLIYGITNNNRLTHCNSKKSG